MLIAFSVIVPNRTLFVGTFIGVETSEGLRAEHILVGRRCSA